MLKAPLMTSLPGAPTPPSSASTSSDSSAIALHGRPLPTPLEEGENLVALLEGSPASLISFLSGQLGVLKTQAQMIMGIAGLIITVTGFSGHHMVRGGTLSTIAMVAGIVFTLGGVIQTVRTLGKIRWVSQDLGGPLHEVAARIIARRNQEQRALTYSGAMVSVGLCAYLISVVLAALHNGAT